MEARAARAHECAGRPRLHLSEPAVALARAPSAVPVLARRRLRAGLVDLARRRRLVARPHADRRRRPAPVRRLRVEREAAHPVRLRRGQPERDDDERPLHGLRARGTETRERNDDRAPAVGPHPARAGRPHLLEPRDGCAVVGVRRRHGTRRPPRRRLRHLPVGDGPPLPLRTLERRRVGEPSDHGVGPRDLHGRRPVLRGRARARQPRPAGRVPVAPGRRAPTKSSAGRRRTAA